MNYDLSTGCNTATIKKLVLKHNVMEKCS